MNQITKESTLKIIPLGGLHEIGKNTCVLEYGDEIILIDAGIAFPTDEMHGVNIVLPDMTYLRENRHKIKGMIATHGHEDHIGGIAYHLKQFDIPIIYGPKLAIALLRDKLHEAGVADRTTLKTVEPREMTRISSSFLVEFIRNTHSIADSFTLAIHTPLGVIIHTGDFKVDYTPIDGEYFDFQKLAEHGEKGVLCLLSDSTNAELPGSTASERSVYPNLDRIISQTEGRLMVTTFASSVHRVNIILQLAQKHKRKVVVIGRSMLNVIAHARTLGYITCSEDLFIPLKAARNIPDKQVLILTTGSQGEPLAALTRISRGEHNHIKVRQGDTIVFSANPIPGNTISVVNTIDRLMMQGANVIYGRHHGIHVSGHGSQEDHKLMLALTRPKFFVPVHGEHRMLVKHAQTAYEMGISSENIIIVKNGDVIELSNNSINVAGKVPSGIELVDQSGVVHENVLQDRQQLAKDGVIIVSASIGEDRELIDSPQVDLRGVVTKVEKNVLQQLVVRAIENILKNRWEDFVGINNKNKINWSYVKEEIESTLQRLIKRELRSEPLVRFVLQISDTSVSTTSDIPAISETKSKANPKVYRRRRSTASAAS